MSFRTSEAFVSFTWSSLFCVCFFPFAVNGSVQSQGERLICSRSSHSKGFGSQTRAGQFLRGHTAAASPCLKNHVECVGFLWQGTEPKLWVSNIKPDALSLCVICPQLQDRTQFSDKDLHSLKRYWDNGMTSLGSVCREKISAASTELSVDSEIIKVRQTRRTVMNFRGWTSSLAGLKQCDLGLTFASCRSMMQDQIAF